MTAYQYFDCLMTMFNILLIIAGILEYVLLGIDFKVSATTPARGGDFGRSHVTYRTASRTRISAAFSSLSPS